MKEKPYQLVIDYVRGEVIHGNLRPGDRLPGERELAEQLGISRNSVREGLRILENMGVTSSQHGAGHYIALNFDEPMTEMLSLIYTMKGMGRDDLTQFRYCLEREAMYLAVDYASEQQKALISMHLEALLKAETEKDRYEHDMALHMTLIEASRNDYLITTYRALTNVIGDKELAPFTKDIIEVDYETSIFDETGDVTLTVNVQYENELLPEDNTASAIITITEPTATAPTSLLAEDKGAAGVDLTWTVAEGGVAEITEAFDDESVFEPFGLGGITADQHTGAFGDWTVYDGNGIGTYGFNGTDFPNAYQPMGFIVFNPSQISEAMAETYAPHSGNQFMVSFCPAEESNAPATDHWMISPELPGTAQTISFFARVITNQYGAETFEVWASSTDNKVENFTKVADLSTDATEWTEFSADLPAGTKYFAIRHTSTDVFGLLIDDVKFSANTTATVASFNIYYNNEKIATVDGDKTTYTVAADKVEVGTQTFGVSAVYANGAESRVTTATIEIVTGIEQIAADGKPVDVYSIDGKLIRNQAKSLDGLKGLYIVNGKKIMVK